MKMRHVKGFTLIEIAIVLLVISLVLGGVLLASNSVIQRGRITSLIAKINDIAGASRAFKSRYGYFPGDMPNAKAQVTANGTVSDGCNYAPDGSNIGNGLVDTETESTCAMEHLVKAGLLSKIDMDAAGAYWVSSEFEGRVSLFSSASRKENAVRVTNIPCEVALEIDRKLDSASDTPLGVGAVLGYANMSTEVPIATCSPGRPPKIPPANDPVATLLIKY